MSIKKNNFHGSDIERIAGIYHLDKNVIINFASNVNPLGVPRSAINAFEDLSPVISSYPDRKYTSLKESLSEYLQVKESYITVGNGSTELISLLIALVCPKKALVIRPTYSEYERELSLIGADIIPYYLKEEREFRLDTEDFLQKINQSIDMVVLCNPNNPTSSAIEGNDLRRIISSCHEKGVFLLIDETYIEFAPDASVLSALSYIDTFDNFMVIRGISKFFASPGLRFGYGITANQGFLSHLRTAQNPWSLNHVGAYLGELMLRDEKYIEETHRLILQERRHITTALLGHPHLKLFPSYGNFFLLKLQNKGLSALDFFEKALKKNLMIRNCADMDGLKGEFIRFGILLPKENQRLIDLLTSLVN